MYIESETEIIPIIKQTSFSIFSIDPKTARKILAKEFKTSAFCLTPDEKTLKITVENVRDFISLTETKEKTEKIFAVLEGEKMNPAAENAFLKSLEEPSDFHHFVIFTTSPSALLPTVLSRAQIYYKKTKNNLEKPIPSDEKIKAYSKKLITADVKTLIELSNEISKKKDNVRNFALEIIACAIEILYKSYFATNQEKYIKKLPNLLKAYDNISKNGHIKLHLVADMI